MPDDTDLTPEVLAELKRLEQAATKGPWRWGFTDFSVQLGQEGIVSGPEDGEGQIVSCANGRGSGDIADEDRDFLIALRNAAPALIAAAKERDRLRELLTELEWGDHTDDWAGSEWDLCPVCGGCRPHGDRVFNNGRRQIGHYEGCRLAAAIGKK